MCYLSFDQVAFLARDPSRYPWAIPYLSNVYPQLAIGYWLFPIYVMSIPYLGNVYSLLGWLFPI